MGRAENLIQNACLELLHFKGVMAWRNNTGAVKAEKRFYRFGQKGSGDIFAIVPPEGKFLSVECKTWIGTVTATQKAWAEMVEEMGGVAIVARSVDDVCDALDEILKGRP